MTAKELKEKYINFFLSKNHKLIPNVSLVPEHDPTALFISAGMHPLVPYLLGEPHPAGRRLVSLQRCVRTVDIDEVGDTAHLTFFEMLGNWSLGDYFKKEAISWSFEFLTKHLQIDPNRLSVTIFAGDENSPFDQESKDIWLSLGIPEKRIFPMPKKDNWWGPAGQTGPCGPDTEMFYDTGKKSCGPNCKPGCFCGKYFEIWNDVFMEFEKRAKSKEQRAKSLSEEDYEFVPLKQKNVDTGMGVERTVAVLNGLSDIYQSEAFTAIIEKIEELSGKAYQLQTTNYKLQTRAMRVIADHLRAATFIITDGVLPSNVEQGYVLRRLIRRAIRFGRQINIASPFTNEIAKVVIKNYRQDYPHLLKREKEIEKGLLEEEKLFAKTLERGLKEFEKLASMNHIIEAKSGEKILPGKIVFKLYDTYGFPLELTCELANEKGLLVDKEGFEEATREHQEKSRAGARQKFAGGLADHSEETAKLHTATHLLHAALRQVLGGHVQQKGSNITEERLRFDFSHDKPLSELEIKRISELVNQKIAEDLPITMEIMTLDKAKTAGALAFFGEKYGEKVKVYSIGDFSREVCGGPHTKRTGELGHFKIIKQESVGKGVRRVKGVIE